ncbi:MAG: ferredoxin-thioredoxin reductase catalytic domain-containing protein [Desulfovibrio sp.]
MVEPSDKKLTLIKNYVQKYCQRTGLQLHSMPDVSEAVMKGLASHMEELGRPLCPCRFYEDKQAEVEKREWLCPCNDMKQYKYCHCMLFVTDKDFPVTEHLPEGHDGKEVYGLITDPAPEKGRLK